MADQVEYRQWLVGAHQTSSQAYDKAIMTLAGGALGLSITFVHELAPHPTHTSWLAVSWSLLAVSLMLTFLSFAASQKTILNQIADIDDPRQRGCDIAGFATTALNVLAGMTFTGGIACLVVFALLNL